MQYCEVCGVRLEEYKKTLRGRVRKYCSNKCRLKNSKNTFKISRYDFYN